MRLGIGMGRRRGGGFVVVVVGVVGGMPRAAAVMSAHVSVRVLRQKHGK